MDTSYATRNNSRDTPVRTKYKPLVEGGPAQRGVSSVGAPQPAMGSRRLQEPGSGASGSGSGDTGMGESMEPIVIAVVGKERAGKTSFINAVTGMSLAVGHDLNPCKLPSCPLVKR